MERAERCFAPCGRLQSVHHGCVPDTRQRISASVVVGRGGASVELCQQLLVSALLRCGGCCGVCVVPVCGIRKAESSVVNKEINAFRIAILIFAILVLCSILIKSSRSQM